MKNLKVQGKEINEGFENEYKIIDNQFEVAKVVQVSNLRGDSKIEDLSGEENDIVDIVMEDGIEWIGPLGDIKEIYSSESYYNRSQLNEDVLPQSLITDQERGVKEWAIKMIGLIKPSKKITEEIAAKIGEKFDQRIMSNPGLFRVDPHFKLDRKEIEKHPKSILLFIHGTSSNTHESFKNIYDEKETGLWNKLIELYPERIYSLEHKTVSVSPVQNAIDALSKIPKNQIVDVISHSRGGIVADILSKCDSRNHIIGFSELEIEKIKREDENLAGLIRELNDLATRKKIQIRKVIRVACPAAGTILLSERLDHFLNGVLNAVRLVMGGPFGQIYNAVKNLILEVIAARLQPNALPGLLPMIPGSTFQQVLNNPGSPVKGELHVIEGNSEIGRNFKHSIAVILTNLFYWEANDFVVNTSSMIYGARRESGVSFMRSEDSNTNHFNYFANQNTQLAIKSAVETSPGSRINGFTYLDSQDGDRGVVLELFMKMGEEKGPLWTKDRTTVILIPGIMGSNLYVNGQKIWVDYQEIMDGKLRSSLHKDANVQANSIIARYYTDFVQHLNASYDVCVFPFDWRLSVSIAAKELKKQIETIQREKNGHPIKIIAHSMGGLVVRALMMEHASFWKNYIEHDHSRLIMLGTPWYGSHLIMEVITGHSRRVKQLALLDFHHSKKDLLETFTTFDGIYQLLPVNDEEFEKQSFWQEIDEKLGNNKFIIPKVEYMQRFAQYKKAILEYQFNFKNIYYIAGKADGTTNEYKFKHSIFGKRLRYYKTENGDGSVTWELGIPKGLNKNNLYYTHIAHENLANDNTIYAGIVEILEEGSTGKLDQTPVKERGGVKIAHFRDDVLSNDPSEALEIIFGGNPHRVKPVERIEELTVKVSHGDLSFADYPVMVGHFLFDGIMNAEAALDRRFNGKLSERHELAIYPGNRGETAVLLDPGNEPKGALVIGLGNPSELTAFNLMKAVEIGIIKYILNIRDNCFHEGKNQISEGITSLLVGSDYGNLPMESAIHAILEGITRANRLLLNLHSDMKIVQKVEFIELYEHLANKAYYILRKIEKQDSKAIQIKIQRSVQKKLGRQKKLEFKQANYWWHNFTTELIKPKKNSKKLPKLRFRLSSGIARVEDDFSFTSQNIIQALLKEMSQKRIWDPEIAKTLFELIVPNSFKDIIRNQSNILWKMDTETTAYPWEMFHDPDQDAEPTFVKAGLIRQMITKDFRKNPRIIKSNTALVIGDPIYENMDLPQLPGAKYEAEEIAHLLRSNNVTVKAEIRSNGVNILKAITNEEYKILHIAGHGIFDPDKRNVGVALGNDMFLSPSILHNLSNVPELVFINCCHSGEVKPAYEKYYTNRYKLAANIGPELIRMGVEAVVVAGWAVNDQAAEFFASRLYGNLLSGYEFGTAVRMARKDCYDQHKNNNTWGAYQCYGDPFYTLCKGSADSNELGEYISEEEALVDLENLWVWAYGDSGNSERILNRLGEILKQAKESGFYQGPVIEMEARIYRELNQIDEAIEKYGSLLALNDSDFKVRSLEHYCNLRAKQIVKHDITDHNKLKKVENDLFALSLIGNTTMRLNLLGSGYKRIAQMSRRIRSREAYLKKMERAYLESYLILQDKIEDAVYPLCNFLSARALREEYDDLEIESSMISPFALLNEAKTKLDAVGLRKNDIWEYIKPINILLCELLFQQEKMKIEKYRDDIIKAYDAAFDLTGSLRHVSTEIEHFEFLLAVWESKQDSENNHKLNAIVDIKEHLEAMGGLSTL